MLKKHPTFPGISGPVVTVVMDGFGYSPKTTGNAIAQAYTPTLDRLLATCPHTLLKAHGKAVGMPSDDDMGNSEVGHNALGSGQIYHQGAALVAEAIASGALFEGTAWREIMDNARQHGSTLHFIGLLSDGNVHSHIDHLKAMIVRAKAEGQRRVRIHILLDGRDVPETSALEYVGPFEAFLAELRDETFDARIASGGGRMNITMDRYEADWGMVERGWHTHVLGEARHFESATQAIETLRAEHTGIIDQDLPPFVVAHDGEPVGQIFDKDSVIFFNFRGDRAIEISRAFEEEEFAPFDRVRHPGVTYAGMLQYDGDLGIPRRYLVAPPAIHGTVGEYLAAEGITQLAISETQKYGHVTYFWNGNRSGKFNESLETYVEIPSDRVPFEQRPWMKSAEITDELIRQIKTGRHRTVRVNYANGDMVGHTGHYQATIIAVEAVDLALSRLLPVIDALGGVALITADHGNADEMYELDKKTGEPQRTPSGAPKAKTSHTLNSVPFIYYDRLNRAVIQNPGDAGLSAVAATTVNLLGYEAPDLWDRGLLAFG
ncbi:phosphoglycerate mutase, 2,3-bisphosphoglycerate-independent [Methylococcus capsulatus str. Bath]|uniref:2,3-bisphosphoglycerate-independent phosphoglycerate mutase n=1 Tax=Methylococcus capsulatus (strain ATCC 33009 / NCIMB 11132 / Bath) TaxID=243233 RepID=Q60AU1_METCA|nr:2,3-bisphosphoglycerate-independent phosphoglycerate mutase [Methylococcus capsulatus]AAU92983.1 phosphoglycerate mutase, 2,3-bisphosphoglycerate-independent [Methylococcus capsulatus str. Bath]